MATRDGGDMTLNDFLEAQGLLNYANKFEEIGARKMDFLIDLDMDILTGDIHTCQPYRESMYSTGILVGPKLLIVSLIIPKKCLHHQNVAFCFV